MPRTNEPGRPKLPVALIAFVVVYMAVFGVLALREGNAEFLIYTASMVVFIGVAVALHLRVGLSAATLWCLAVWGCLHMGGGTVPIPAAVAQTDSTRTVLYSLRPWADLPRYDQVTHAFGFFSATLACFECLVAFAGRPRRVGVGLCVAAGLMGVGLGACNEVLEFAVTLVVKDHNVGGYVNTGWDLVSNTVGATIAGTLCWVRSRAAGDAPESA
ncbi:MAG: DUF2238 domain-containing protein [Phycisphaerales bacterium]